MLLQLNIKNFALIESLSISFHEGFNVFSGETGAGKSILIDAINFLLGGKFNRDIIRTGEERTFIEGIFVIKNKKTFEVLDELDIPKDDLLIISREAFSNGKSIGKINGKSVNISTLKLVGDTILDITGQHENQILLNNANHIFYLDSFGEDTIEKALNDYREKYNDLLKVKAKIEELSGKDGEREKIIDFLKYQIEEIESAKLKTEEEDELEEKFKLLSNAEKISKVLNEAYEGLNGNEEGVSIINTLNIIGREVKSIENSFPKIKFISDTLETCYYTLEECMADIRNLSNNIYFDEEELSEINSRIYFINGLKKKYGHSVEEILSYKEKIQNQYDELINSEEILIKLKNDENILKEKVIEHGKILHEIRCDFSKELELEIKEELSYIGLEKSTFKVVIEEENPNMNGIDKVIFNISTNPGEPLRPLEKVVSGGELSRIMLALKTVFVHKDNIPTVIFDEIDTGISGRVAQCVGEKIFGISKSHQVFCVTHLPQISCMSDYHYLVSKEVINDKTFSRIKFLNIDEKEEEIARMIGGAEVTELTLAHSREMIKLAEEKKLNFK